tara:strand:- start:12840 stop:14342 length:1503 start_codon:yes stop_codon:yes gene_type:complete
MKNLFDNLFVLDLANNHFGDIVFGKKIINEFSKLIIKKKINAGIKLQLRHLDTLIHKDHKKDKNNKYIKRFNETKINLSQFNELIKTIKLNNILTIATPFDEKSVTDLIQLDIDILKVASCSASDQNIIKEIAKYNKPLIVSTGGMDIHQVDWVVNYLKKKNSKFAIMHCVSIYPTQDDQLNLGQINVLKNRYNNVPIGFSTHENQNNTNIIQMAYALGAQLFERHIGIKTNKYGLNNYSSTSLQLGKWIDSFIKSKKIIGSIKERNAITDLETSTLNSLKRGIYLKKNIKKNNKLTKNDIYFSMPLLENQLTSEIDVIGKKVNDFIKKDKPLFKKNINFLESKKDKIRKIIYEVDALLINSKIKLQDNIKYEISHHYGLKRFREYGVVLFDCINREYCKKILVVLPRQKHPSHMHKIKEECFQLLSGDLTLTVNGVTKQLKIGEIIVVKRGAYHKFQSNKGCVFEEISTKHIKSDSYYFDKEINSNKNRKTIIDKRNLF